MQLDFERAQTIFIALERSAEQFFADEEIPQAQRAVQRQIDMRYAGLSNEMSVELTIGSVFELAVRDAIQTYHHEFHQLTGHSHEGQEAVELVNLARDGCRAAGQTESAGAQKRREYRTCTTSITSCRLSR